MLDTGLARPPSPTYTAITPATRAPERNDPAAKTDLPAEETVAPINETEEGMRAADKERRQDDPVAPQMDRRNVVDPESDSLVYIATNIETGQVVRQIPSETLLRLRAYTDSVEKQQSGQPQQSVQTVI